MTENTLAKKVLLICVEGGAFEVMVAEVGEVGEKRDEYRDRKKYWDSRLEGKTYKHVMVFGAVSVFSEDAAWVLFEWKGHFVERSGGCGRVVGPYSNNYSKKFSGDVWRIRLGRVVRANPNNRSLMHTWNLQSQTPARTRGGGKGGGGGGSVGAKGGGDGGGGGGGSGSRKKRRTSRAAVNFGGDDSDEGEDDDDDDFVPVRGPTTTNEIKNLLKNYGHLQSDELAKKITATLTTTMKSRFKDIDAKLDASCTRFRDGMEELREGARGANTAATTQNKLLEEIKSVVSNHFHESPAELRGGSPNAAPVADNPGPFSGGPGESTGMWKYGGVSSGPFALPGLGVRPPRRDPVQPRRGLQPSERLPTATTSRVPGAYPRDWHETGPDARGGVGECARGSEDRETRH